MTQFLFELELSTDRTHRAVAFKKTVYSVKVTLSANSINGVKEFAAKLMIIPGVYFLRIANAEHGSEWRIFDPIDTRNPEAVAETVKKLKSRRPVKK